MIARAANDAAIRVLLLTDHVGGGTGRHILTLLEAFDPARARVLAVSEGTVADGPMSRRVERLPQLPHLHRFPFAQAHNLHALTHALEQSPVDVLHTYGLWPILYGRLLKRLGIVEHIVENRECDGHNWNAHVYPLLRAGGHLPDRVVCVSRSVADRVMENEGLDADAIAVIENGVPQSPARCTREEARERLDLPADAIVIGTVVSNIDREVKGIQYLIDAAPEIIRHVPQARFVVVGERPPDGWAVRRLRERQLAARFTLPGYRPDVGDLYPAVDIVALPSLSEGLPLTLIEAMRHGIPIVATRVGGMPEVVTDEETGFLVEARDSATLADRIVTLSLDPTLRDRMGQRGNRRFRQSFSIERTARRYEQLYASVAGTVRCDAGASRDTHAASLA